MALLFSLLLAAQESVPPPEPLAGELRGAIWSDLQSNGMIGNGNHVAADWMNLWGSQGDAPALHLLGLACRGNNRVQRCRFDLLRDGGPIQVDGRTVGDRIRCQARLERGRDAERSWLIPHLPPRPEGGHSRTTLRCNWVVSPPPPHAPAPVAASARAPD